MRILLLALIAALPALADVCPEFPQRAQISITSATGNQQVIAAPAAGKSITICGYQFAASGAGAIAITSGTGTNCASSTTTVAALGTAITGATRDRSDYPLPVASASAVCLNLGATVSVTGTMFYVVR